MKSKGRHISASAVFVLGTAVVMLLFSELWRLILLLRAAEMAHNVPATTLLESFLIGARFDFRVISILLLPVFLLGTIPAFDISGNRLVRKAVLILISLFAAVVFFLHLVDIEFFKFFNTRLNGSVLLWSDTPGDVVSMIWAWYPVIWYLLLYLVVLGLFILAETRLMRKTVEFTGQIRWWVTLVYVPVVLLIFALGATGRIYQTAPMRWGLAYFSEYDFANQLTLNPVYIFARDVFYDAHKRQHIEELVTKMSQPGAEETVRRMLAAPDPDSSAFVSTSSQSTLASHHRMMRERHFSPPNEDPPNVILIIMESFASTKIDCLRSQYPYVLTPGFDSLASRGILFTNFYSAGTHTCSGLFNTLTGSPHLFGKVLMKQVPGHGTYRGLPAILRANGYHTLFFTTQDPQFDNMQGFVRANGVEEVYSVFDYRGAEQLSWLGVPDHVMFDYAYDRLKRTAATKGRFFATLLTGSNHGPWLYPDVPFERIPDSEPRHDEFNSLKYSDWALARFVNMLASDSAFRNTLFVVTADNGYMYDVTTDLDLSILEIPLLLYNTDWHWQQGIVNDRLGCQLDILATVMGEVRLDYDDYSFGVDLLDTTADVEDFVFATRWHEVGYIQDGYYFIMRLNRGPESLFKLDNKALDLSDSLPDLKDEYRRRAAAVYETAYRNFQRALGDYRKPGQLLTGVGH